MGLAGVFAVNSCKKSASNPLLTLDNLAVGSYITLAEKTNVNLDYADLDNSTVSIKVDQYGSEVASIDMYIVAGANTDTTNWHFLKSVPFTGDGTVLSTDAAEIANALGEQPADLSPGSNFTIYDRVITKDGRRFDVTNINPAVESNSNYNMALRWSIYIVCPFTGGMAGKYAVVEDDWQDWSPGDSVIVTDGPGANEINLAQVWPNPAYGTIVDSLVVEIDPATGAATVPAVDFADYGYLTSVISGSGYVFSCAGYISLSIDLNAAGYGDQGIFKLVLQK